MVNRLKYNISVCFPCETGGDVFHAQQKGITGMKSRRNILALLCAGLLFLLTACAGSDVHYFYMDVDGNAHWDIVEGAVEYEAELLNENSDVAMTFRPNADETSTIVPGGYTLRIRPVFEDGSTGDWMVQASSSDGSDANTAKERVLSNYKIYWQDLSTYELLPNIDRDSVETHTDGSIYFEAAAPDGGVIRFSGTGIELADDSIILQPNSELCALDAIGRIAAVEFIVTDSGDAGNWFWAGGGYTFTDATSVDSPDQLYRTPHLSMAASEPDPKVRCTDYQPNFITFGADYNADAITISSVTVYFDDATYNTGLRLAALDLNSYTAYLTGEYYDPLREGFKADSGIYDFVLALFPDVSDEDEPMDVDVMLDDVLYAYSTLYDVEDSLYTIGALRDAAGNELDKDTDTLMPGCTLDVTIGDYTMAVELPVVDRYDNAQTLHELAPYNNADAQGEKLSLVVPIFWQDQPETATDEMLDTMYAKLGRVMDADGTVTDYSENLSDAFSLSEYFDISSYSRYEVTSFVTDWYAAPYDFEEMQNVAVAGNTEFRDEVYAWIMATYPDMDWSRFDADGDGFFDSVIFINAGESSSDSVPIMGYGYALFIGFGYTGDGAGTQNEPTIKNFVNINKAFLDGNTLIHEVSHSFGLIDYYDVSYSGIDAVGCYDMQSDSFGDWNAFSKYAVGWIEPEVVSGLNSGETLEITIGSFAKTGDAVVIPAAGTDHDGPFGEYILLDLFTADGTNRYDAAQFDLDNAVGVRVSHVNANMERRVLTGEDGTEYPIGTTHFANDYSANGRYQIEVIQSGGTNTFTDPAAGQNRLTQDDLFTTGDTFDAENYAEFLTDGRMDDGSEFGYTVEIADIRQDDAGDYSATLRITRK